MNDKNYVDKSRLKIYRVLDSPFSYYESFLYHVKLGKINNYSKSERHKDYDKLKSISKLHFMKFWYIIGLAFFVYILRGGIVCLNSKFSYISLRKIYFARYSNFKTGCRIVNTSYLNRYYYRLYNFFVVEKNSFYKNFLNKFRFVSCDDTTKSKYYVYDLNINSYVLDKKKHNNHFKSLSISYIKKYSSDNNITYKQALTEIDKVNDPLLNL